MRVFTGSIITIFLLIGAAVIYPQANTGGDAAVAEKPVNTVAEGEKKSAEEKPAASVPSEVKPVPAVEQPRPARPIAADARREAQVPPAPVRDDEIPEGFLSAEDPRLLYGRISGMVFPKIESPAVNVAEVVPAEAIPDVEPQGKGDKSKGTFGLKAKTADLFAKISIVVLILVIILIYRIRIARSGSSVIRGSYPKKNKR